MTNKTKIQCVKTKHCLVFTMTLLLVFYVQSPSFSATFIESFLKDGIGVRPLGMGGAFAALSDDSNAVYYNPASLSEANAQYTRGYMDMSTDFYDVNDCYAVTAAQAGLASWNRWDKNGDKATTTSVAFGTRGDSGVAWGVAYKNTAWNISGSQDRGWSLDAGLLAPITKEVRVGMLVQDFVKSNTPISASVRAGVAYSPEILRNTFLVFDSEFRNLKAKNGADIYLHYGAESKIAEGLVLRAGWQRDRYSAGATATFPYMVVDYAVVLNPDSKNSQMFGFRMGEEK